MVQATYRQSQEIMKKQTERSNNGTEMRTSNEILLSIEARKKRKE